MDITVEVYSERVSTGEREHTHSAHVVFVAVGQQRKPRAVPRLVPETPEEHARYQRAGRYREEQARR
jgi:acyl-CoA hydrolase